ncbi:hypothetical protein EDI_061570 [Entamoeba dispar SAW760]|uniref:Uncharacterized protein n=1 Tax=Entamoeba dispar (strain ATCC PRA-260 / SAW760) TaxID=370354 RepID=B0E6P8_ENTDS|nr:uncharacterized protein EDI_061570 [Entamoeba dispar SAW760]EDR29802.1 hypothetical protein EDI_061570 [Entamoeba dispar SAW760]|eukprot:EDR29802.1 hypothetical protein EDI_061570 [Entamoeba dispar SAW760]
MSENVNWEEILGMKINELDDKKCKAIVENSSVIQKINEVIHNNLTVCVVQFIYQLASDENCELLVRTLIPSLLYRVLCSPTPDIMAAFVRVYNERYKHLTKESYNYPFMSNLSVFYKPTVNKNSSKLTKQSLNNLEIIEKQSQLDELLHEVTSVNISNEEMDLMLAFLIRDFGKLLVNESNDIHQIYLHILQEIILFYSQKTWNLSHYFTIEVAMTLSYLIDNEDLSLFKDVFNQCMDYAQTSNNFSMLLILTQYEEYLTLHTH